MNLVRRDDYLKKLHQWRHKDMIKVITGVRRCGKSTLLRQFQDDLKLDKVDDNQIIYLNMEDVNNRHLLNYISFHEEILKHITSENQYYLFIVEVQMIEEFEKAISSLHLRDNIDIYVTGSNAKMLSSEIGTLLSGRYIEIRMLPFSFKEFFSIKSQNEMKAFREYLTYGSFPYVSGIREETNMVNDYLEGLYNTIIVNDIMSRAKINDMTTLKQLVVYIFDNVGNITSVNKIANTITSNGKKISNNTIEKYLEVLEDCFLIYRVSRYDIKGKEHLKSLNKFYIVDTGLRFFLLGNRNVDEGRILENLIYFELLRKGYRVSIGKVGNLEVDFVATRGTEIKYVQVSLSILNEETKNREIRSLKEIRDFHERLLITMDYPLVDSIDGIKHINAIDFLLND